MATRDYKGRSAVENEYINKLSTIKTNLKKTLKNIQEDDFLRTNSHFTALVPSIVECLMKIDSIPDRYVTLFESNKAHFLETMEQQNSSKKSTKEKTTEPKANIVDPFRKKRKNPKQNHNLKHKISLLITIS